VTGAWDDPAVQAAVAAQVDEGRARRARLEAEAPARVAHLLERLTRWDVPRDVALSVLAGAWHEGWTTGFHDADRVPCRPSACPFG
jgi:hypothetical protein